MAYNRLCIKLGLAVKCWCREEILNGRFRSMLLDFRLGNFLLRDQHILSVGEVVL
jgi:hypothetical protein